MSNSHFKSAVLNLFSGVKPGSQFIVIKNYKSEESGEVADYSVVFGISYENAVKRSLAILKDFDLKSVKLNHFTAEHLKEAHMELIDSFNETIIKGTGNNQAYTKQGYYENILPGVKFSDTTQKLYIYGMKVNKRVIEEGIYKKVNSRPKTIAKNVLKSHLPVSKFREWCITPESFNSISIGKLNVTVEELLK